MQEFEYRAKNSSGSTVTGRESAPSEKDAILKLQRKNLVILSMKKADKKEKKPSGKIFGELFSGGSRVKTFDLTVFCRQLATMIQGGVPILRAIESIMSDMSNKRLKAVLQDVMSDLRDGNRLSESLVKYPDTFSFLFNAIVEAGEKVGALDSMLFRLSGYLESRDRLRRKLRSATTYPIFITIFFFGTIAVMALFLIPRFQSIYESLGAKLPPLTLFIFNTSGFIIRNIFILLPIFVGAILALLFFAKHTKTGRVFTGRMALKMPIFGIVIKKVALSKFCRTLSTLLTQGIPVTEALLMVGRTSDNVIIEDASVTASRLIVEGEGIPEALEKTGVFTPLLMQMASVGVDAGSLPELMDKTADFYEEQVDAFVSTLTTMIEPILVVTLGVLIGIVVLAVYLPIFRLTSAMAGGH